MKKTTKKLLAMGLGLAMLTVAGCSGGGSASSSGSSGSGTTAAAGSESTGKVGTEEKVELVMYLPGPRPARYDAVLEEFNKMTMEDLNCTVKINFVDFADLQTKYPLMFSSGEEFDLGYAGTWINFVNMAQKGAYMPLEDMLPLYCEESLKLTPEESLEQATVNGHVYAYPTNYYTYSAYGVMARGDRMEKYGFDDFEKIEDVVEFLKVIKENEPQFTNPFGMWKQQVLSDIWMERDNLYPITGGQYGIYYIDLNAEQPTVIAAHEWEGYKDFVTKTKEWADLGLWPKSALSINDSSRELFKAGASAATFGNFDQGIEAYQLCDPSWDVRWYNMQPHVNHLAYTQDCMVIPASSKHPERALMLLDKIKTDERYYDMLVYGIEGEDFTRDENNRYTSTDIVQFPAEPGTWGFRSQQWYLAAANYPDDYDEQKQALEDQVEPNIFRNFNVDTEPVKTEYAAMINAYAQYNDPLEMGMSTDIDKDIEQLKQKAEAAGHEKVKAEFQRQVDEFYAANKDK